MLSSITIIYLDANYKSKPIKKYFKRIIFEKKRIDNSKYNYYLIENVKQYLQTRLSFYYIIPNFFF